MYFQPPINIYAAESTVTTLDSPIQPFSVTQSISTSPILNNLATDFAARVNFQYTDEQLETLNDFYTLPNVNTSYFALEDRFFAALAPSEVTQLTNFLNTFPTTNAIIDPADLNLTLISTSSDRDVYQIPDLPFVLKAQYGTQRITIRSQFADLILPYIEFFYSNPMQDQTYESDKRHFFQIQRLCDSIAINNPLDETALKKELNRAFVNRVASKGVAINFALAVLVEYGPDYLNSYLDSINLAYDHPISSTNWGYYNNKPVIFDAGPVVSDRVIGSSAADDVTASLTQEEEAAQDE